jgi:hypothetical protein
MFVVPYYRANRAPTFQTQDLNSIPYCAFMACWTKFDLADFLGQELQRFTTVMRDLDPLECASLFWFLIFSGLGLWSFQCNLNAIRSSRVRSNERPFIVNSNSMYARAVTFKWQIFTYILMNQ